MVSLEEKSRRELRKPRITKWHESLYAVDLVMLHAAPVYYGVGVPRGDGSPVMMIPGFMHSDVYLVVMYAWLKRLGYCPYYSGIELNADCPDILIKHKLSLVIDEAIAETGKRVHLIGHSLGGVLARSLATQRPGDIASVITLGSPFPGCIIHGSILRETEVVRRFILNQRSEKVHPECYTEACHCDFMKSLHRGLPARVKQTAIYTRNDGILDWHNCKTGRRDVDVEVGGTHSGLAFNPTVYQIIAERLATHTARRVRPKRTQSATG